MIPVLFELNFSFFVFFKALYMSLNMVFRLGPLPGSRVTLDDRQSFKDETFNLDTIIVVQT